MSKINGSKQMGEATYYRKRNKNDSELDINKSIMEQFNILRITDNLSTAHFFSKIKIYLKN